MQLLVFRALWGMTEPTVQAVERIAAAGYDGVEGGLPDDLTRDEFMNLLTQHNLHFIAGAQVSERDQLDQVLKRLAEYEPLRIDLHSGRDCMTRDAARAFFERALEIEAEIGVPVGHETHRGRVFFTPWDTAFFLNEYKDLKIVADYSHWVNVCERLPEDQANALRLANRRAIHIHGRVGYEQGPQVPDPRAPEYAAHVEWHEEQWQEIKQFHGEHGAEMLTFTPEYGPPRYLHTMPHTDEPVADLWDICLWGAERARSLLG